MKIKLLLLSTSLLMLFFFACETTEKIDDFPLRPSKLVVNCFFAPYSTWEFQVSKSLSVLDNADLKFIDNATIKIFKDSVLLETITEQDEDKWYRTENNLPEIGGGYSIEVSSPGFGKKLFAEDYVPQVISVTGVDITITDSMFYDGGDYSYGSIEGDFDVKFTDPPDIENYYKLSIFYYDTVYFDYQNPSKYKIVKNELSISSEDVSVITKGDYNNSLLLTDVLFDGQNYQLKVSFTDWNAHKEKQYIIELVSLNKSGYLYRRTIDDYNQSQNDPFAEPVQIYCNVENGYGIFSGYSTFIYPVSIW